MFASGGGISLFRGISGSDFISGVDLAITFKIATERDLNPDIKKKDFGLTLASSGVRNFASDLASELGAILRAIRRARGVAMRGISGPDLSGITDFVSGTQTGVSVDSLGVFRIGERVGRTSSGGRPTKPVCGESVDIRKAVDFTPSETRSKMGGKGVVCCCATD